MESMSLTPIRPNWRESVTALVVNSLVSPHTRVAYGHALNLFFDWWDYSRPFSKAVVNEWRMKLEADGYSSSTVNMRLSAIRKLANELADNGLITPEMSAAVARVRGVKRQGVRSGNWLSRDQTQAVLSSPDDETLQGKRDRALLAILTGCGLRRSEACALTMAHIAQREGRWCIVDLIGKHGRIRTVPMPAWVKVAIDKWTTPAGITEGCVLRAVNRAGRVWGAGITPKVVRQVTMRYGAACGVQFAPHDARRTFAKLCRTTGAELEQIQLLLGHASIQTTERYLGSKLNLEHAANDRLALTA